LARMQTADERTQVSISLVGCWRLRMHCNQFFQELGGHLLGHAGNPIQVEGNNVSLLVDNDVGIRYDKMLEN
jgi:hypothetical protein